MALVIAGDRSGVGKTTVTLALLMALVKHQSRAVQSFKVGPDYIDPMFHRYVTGRPCHNLDPVLTSARYVQRCFSTHSQSAEAVLIEGVMGLFDGIPHNSAVLEGRASQLQLPSTAIMQASTAHVAWLLGLPIMLVVDCSRLSGSIAAIVHGYRSLCPKLKIAGLVLNRVASDRHLDLLKFALEPLKCPVLGVLRREQAVKLPERHLGLVPTAELPELDQCLEELLRLGQICFDWVQLEPLLTAPQQSSRGSRPENNTQTRQLAAVDLDAIPLDLFDLQQCPTLLPPIRIAIASDAAFNFHYADNLACLEALGAELIEFSPLQDKQLPPGSSGLILGGGFPELFATELAANRALKTELQQAIQAGLPTYVECGGLMYLCTAMLDFKGQKHEMVGILPAQTLMGQKLTLGYRRAIAQPGSPFIEAGTVVWGHEFHRSNLEGNNQLPLFELHGHDLQALQTEGWCPKSLQLHASYVHLHWGAQPHIAKQFLQHCASYAVTVGFTAADNWV